jgi:hypothetical protein
MKRIVLLLTALLCFSSAFSQDIIIKSTGEELKVKVTEINSREVLYKWPDSLQRRTFSLPKTEVWLIKYANGHQEIVSPASSETAANQTTENPLLMYEQGRQDAKHYYKGRGIMLASFGATLVFPYGYAVPFALGASPPKVKPERVSDIRFLKDSDYIKGYQRQAQIKKAKKAAAGAGLGTLALFGLVILAITHAPY